MFSPLDISLCCAVRSMLRVYSLNVPQNSQRYKICNVFRLFSFLSFHQLVLTIAIYLYVHAALITAQKFTVLSHWCVFTMYVVLWKKRRRNILLNSTSRFVLVCVVAVGAGCASALCHEKSVSGYFSCFLYTYINLSKHRFEHARGYSRHFRENIHRVQ